MAIQVAGAAFSNTGSNTARTISRSFMDGEFIIALSNISNIKNHGTPADGSLELVKSIERTDANGPTLDIYTKQADGSETEIAFTYPSSNNSLHVYYDDVLGNEWSIDPGAVDKDVLSGGSNSVALGPTDALEDEDHYSLAVACTLGNPESVYAFTNSFDHASILAGQLGHRMGSAWKSHSGTAAQSSTASWTTSRLLLGTILSWSLTAGASEGQKQFNLDAILKAEFGEAFNLDAFLFAIGEKGFNLDALLVPSFQTKQFNLDAFLSTLVDVDIITSKAELGWKFGRPTIGGH